MKFGGKFGAGFSFQGRWIALAATLVVAISGVLLGQWQTRRGDEKQAIQARMSERSSAPAMILDGAVDHLDPAQGEYRRVRLRGQFLPDWTVYLDNRPYQGRPGLYVLTPFKIAGTNSAVIIERGWISRDLNDRSKLPVLPTPQGELEIEGVLRLGVGHLLQLGSPEPIRAGAMLQNLDIAAFANVSGISLLAFVIEQRPDVHNSSDGLVRDWPPASLGIERHRGYAVQWYALALMAIIFFVVTGFRSGKK
ncbi:cytochrome oxidase assembly protein ShyY1 [Herbaspirillum sp. Sphag1AN]|uniref:SURF1 family protein n=1 Tax=unclassified Herbaspirillum TaxID=2624150 RepID=UPI0017EEB68E|nr:MULTISPECIES: SURF1 family protein [unclassified Herbaspirillum]MBB3212617.1 cytochrome oxidase assembly protein ShyY1 [Herbaspirillum sp. Sphag1AN]MBB3245814.1 cytochrome oxidase assembly protein ShyY1 [Herbaspirillum sp. Sphag64]